MKINKLIVLAVLAACPFLVFSAPKAKGGEAHPNLMFSLDEIPGIKERVQSLPWTKELFAGMVADADRFMSVKTDPYALSDRAEGFGMGTAGRAFQVRVENLAFVGYVTGQEKYLQKAREILLAVVRQTDPGDGKSWNTHLQVGDAAQGFALGYDLVYPYLSEAEREEVREQIRKVGEYTFKDHLAWDMESVGVTSCNHSAVRSGGLGLCALVLGDRPEWIDFATRRIDGYYTWCADATGYMTEGHHYMSYGLAGAYPYTHALKRVKGVDLCQKHKALFEQAGEQMVWKLLPDYNMLAMNDNNEEPCGSAAVIGGLLYNKPVQLWAWLQSMRDPKTGKLRKIPYGLPYTHAYLFLVGDKPLAPVPAAEAKTPLGKQFESGRVFLRSGWNDKKDAHFSFTSGWDRHRGHDHQDENSLTFYALGDGFIVDPQYQAEFGDCHTTLLIGKSEQIKSGDGRLVAYREDPDGAFVQGQAEEAYDFVSEFVGSVDRKAYFVRNAPVAPYLIWRDDAMLENDVEFECLARYITYPDNLIRQRGKGVVIKGGKNGSTAYMAVFSGAGQVQLSEENLGGKTFLRKGEAIPYLKYMRRLTVSVKKMNPELVTLVIPFVNDTDIPKIEVTQDERTRDIFCTLTFADGTRDSFTLTYGDIKMERKQ